MQIRNREDKLDRIIASPEYMFFMSYARSLHLDGETSVELIQRFTDELNDPYDTYLKNKPIMDRISEKMAKHIELKAAS